MSRNVTPARCRSCGAPMMPGTTSVAATPTGVVRHHARGLCRVCYHRDSYVPATAAQVVDLIVDEVAVRRAAGGERLPLTRREMAAAVDYLTTRGASQREIADRLHITERTVVRWAFRLRDEQFVSELRESIAS